MKNPKDIRKIKFVVWLTEPEHELLQQVGVTTGQGMSSYVRSTVLKAIKDDFGLTVNPEA
jgi:hypothetical protein